MGAAGALTMPGDGHWTSSSYGSPHYSPYMPGRNNIFAIFLHIFIYYYFIIFTYAIFYNIFTIHCNIFSRDKKNHDRRPREMGLLP